MNEQEPRWDALTREALRMIGDQDLSHWSDGHDTVTIAALRAALAAGGEALANFPAYLLDHCEGETVSEEGLQRWLAAMLADPKYAAAPASQAAGGEPDAWMWQHPENGRVGFIEHASKEDLDQWERMNKPRRIIAPMYRGAAPAAAVEPTDAPLWAVIGELRGEAHEVMASDKSVGIQPNPELADMLNEWADRLETTATAFYEDVYDQCAAAIRPLVDAGKLPGSVVESLQMLVSERAAAAPEGRTEREPWLLYLSDRADGVKGRYAVARWNPAGYREVWNLRGHGWSAYSDDVLTLEQAHELLRTARFGPATPDAKTAEARKPLTEELRTRATKMANAGWTDYGISVNSLQTVLREVLAAHGIGDQP